MLFSGLLQLPLSLYEELALERRYGLSTQSTGRWWLDQAKGIAVTLVFGVVGALLVLALLRWTPDYWWLVAGACFSVILIGLAQLAPVVLLPLFYDFKPLERAALADRLVALAERAGARVLGVFEWRLSDRTRKANAALAGIGRTRRILLSDTLLAEHSDDEIEVILAHELAHHVYRDIWTGIALEAGLILAGFYLADVALTQFAGRLGLAGKADVAGLPLLLLTAGASVTGAAAALQCVLARARAPRRSLRARDDAQRRRVRDGDAPSGGAESRRRASVAAGGGAVLHAPSNSGEDCCGAAVAEPGARASEEADDLALRRFDRRDVWRRHPWRPCRPRGRGSTWRVASSPSRRRRSG